MKVKGKLEVIGRLGESELSELVGRNGAQVRLADGRLITVAGMSDVECRALARWFMEPVVLDLDMEVPF